jgi:hypothetical protein
MRKKRDVQAFYITWQGIPLRVTFERNWLGSENPITAHLQITAKDRQALPVTETGYRSHSLPAWQVDDEGGPVAYARSWLDSEAAKPAWRQAKAARRQLTLF